LPEAFHTENYKKSPYNVRVSITKETRHKDGFLLVAGVGFEPTTFGL